MVSTGKELARRAEQHGATVLIEPVFCGFFASAKRTRVFLEEVDSPRIRELLDPANPWENGYVESFNARMRDELLNGEIFLHIYEVRYVVNRWRMDYNHYRPHSSLRYMTPAEFAQLCHEADCVRPKRLLYKNEKVRGNTLIKVGP